jgi:hypothetical protein
MIEPQATLEHVRVGRAALRAGPAGPHECAGQSGRSTGWAGNGRTHVRASRAVVRSRTNIGRPQDTLCPPWAVPPEVMPEDVPDVLY